MRQSDAGEALDDDRGKPASPVMDNRAGFDNAIAESDGAISDEDGPQMTILSVNP